MPRRRLRKRHRDQPTTYVPNEFIPSLSDEALRFAGGRPQLGRQGIANLEHDNRGGESREQALRSAKNPDLCTLHIDLEKVDACDTSNIAAQCFTPSALLKKKLKSGRVTENIENIFRKSIDTLKIKPMKMVKLRQIVLDHGNSQSSRFMCRTLSIDSPNIGAPASPSVLPRPGNLLRDLVRTTTNRIAEQQQRGSTPSNFKQKQQERTYADVIKLIGNGDKDKVSSVLGRMLSADVSIPERLSGVVVCSSVRQNGNQQNLEPDDKYGAVTPSTNKTPMKLEVGTGEEPHQSRITSTRISIAGSSVVNNPTVFHKKRPCLGVGLLGSMRRPLQ